MRWGIFYPHRRSRAAWCAALVATMVLGALFGTVRADDDCDCPHKRTQRTQWRAQSGFTADPVGWVAIGYDYDDDGEFDAFEYIYGFDLEEARDSSRMRARRTGGDDFARPRAGMRMIREVEGEIADLRTVKFVDMDEPHVMAELETPRGNTMEVCLGPRDKIDQLGLREGDDVTVFGRRIFVNDRPVIMARLVEADGKSVRVSRDNSRMGLKRVRGEILDTFTAVHGDDDRPHFLATVRLDDGRTTTVDLGPEGELGHIDLTGGDRVTVFGKHENVDGSTLLLARQLEANGRTINIKHEKKSDRFWDDRERGSFDDRM